MSSLLLEGGPLDGVIQPVDESEAPIDVFIRRSHDGCELIYKRTRRTCAGLPVFVYAPDSTA